MKRFSLIEAIQQIENHTGGEVTMIQRIGEEETTSDAEFYYDLAGSGKILPERFICQKADPEEPATEPDHNGFISVQERLPENNQFILCQKRTTDDIDRMAIYRRELGFQRYPENWFIPNITHWKPYTL